MTSQQDTELEKILIRYRSTADAAWSEVKDGFYTQEEYEVALRKISDEAIQALTSWKDKEVKSAELKARLVELDLLEQIINRWHDNKMMSKTHIAYLDEYKMKRLKDLTDRLESLQSQGGKK